MDQQQLQTLVDGVIRGIFVELEASGRHVHVTKEQAMELFGHALTPKRPLSQPGQFLNGVQCFHCFFLSFPYRQHIAHALRRGHGMVGIFAVVCWEERLGGFLRV